MELPDFFICALTLSLNLSDMANSFNAFSKFPIIPTPTPKKTHPSQDALLFQPKNKHPSSQHNREPILTKPCQYGNLIFIVYFRYTLFHYVDFPSKLIYTLAKCLCFIVILLK